MRSDWSREALPRPARDLADLIAGRSPSPLEPRSTLESGETLELLLECWQILPSLGVPHLDEAIGRTLCPADYRRLTRARLALTAFAKVQIRTCRQLLRAFDEHGLHYCLLKGSATAFLLYPEPYMRAAWDFDIGVDRADLADAERLARAVGYHAAQQDPVTQRFYRADPAFRASVEENHYELGFLVRRIEVTNLPAETREAIVSEPSARRYWFDVETGVPRCYASVDIHHALSLDIPLTGLLASARSVAYEGQPLRVPDAAWLAAHLVFKLYWEGVHAYRRGLYAYADLLRLIPHLDGTVFDRLVGILGTYRLVAAGHYVFRRVPLFGVALPEHVARFVEETRSASPSDDPVRLNDLGDMWPKLWGGR